MHIVPAPEQDNQPILSPHTWEVKCKYMHNHKGKMGVEVTIILKAADRLEAEAEAKRLAATEVFGNDLHRRHFMVIKSTKKR